MVDSLVRTNTNATHPPQEPETGGRGSNLSSNPGSSNTSRAASLSDEEPTTLSRSSSQRSQRRSRLHNALARVSAERPVSRAASLRNASRRSSLETLHEHGRLDRSTLTEVDSNNAAPAAPRKLLIRRTSSLRNETRAYDDLLDDHKRSAEDTRPASSGSAISPSDVKKLRPVSLPPPARRPGGPAWDNLEKASAPHRLTWTGSTDPWALPALPPSVSTPQLPPAKRPSSTFRRYSSLDHLMEYREERQSWKQASRLSTSQLPDPAAKETLGRNSGVTTSLDESSPIDRLEETDASQASIREAPEGSKSKFRHVIAEIGFCWTIAMTQFLMEYLISGFALVLPNLVSKAEAGTGSTGIFWPAILLTLILSATLLIFARISDMHGGYIPFMFGLIWLTIWTLIPGFYPVGVILDVARAMQGLAIAAFSPSTFALLGMLYPDGGPRKNIVLGLYGACAPLGFYAGFLAGGALPSGDSRWYFFIAAALSFLTAITAWLCVPAERTGLRKQFRLKMDWLGAFLITGGLILVAYALAVEPYVASNTTNVGGSGFGHPKVYAPLACGMVCLIVAVWVEGWYADCALLPFEFFAPQGVKPFSIACLFFYASFGVWLYNSADFLGAEGVTNNPSGIHGIIQTLYYTPMAIGGIVFCIVGGSLVHVVPVKLLLILSGIAWVGAPLIFAVGTAPLNYWREIMPSMICATLGIDLTFTLGTIVLSASQPQKYQGVAGAVSSILVNLAMSFALPISLIVKEAATASVASEQPVEANIYGFRGAFLYGTGSAAIGLLIAVFFVRIPRSVVDPRSQNTDIERPRPMSSATSTFALANK